MGSTGASLDSMGGPMQSSTLGNAAGGGASMAAMGGIIGGVMSAWGDYTQGVHQKKAYEFNADLALQRAQETRAAEVLHQTQMERQKQHDVGMLPAEYAGRGVKANTGSPIDVMVDNISQWNQDMAISKYNAEVSARGYENQAALLNWHGKQAKREGTSKAIMGLFSTVVSASAMA